MGGRELGWRAQGAGLAHTGSWDGSRKAFASEQTEILRIKIRKKVEPRHP